ncbi:hypothetical protein [Mycobacterium marinum]|uniref:hypothetical protein n=1 Tax=Mycobacterium marinum TaxID=1781 RepID=UPI00235927BE|nr:hypothetical protein [Mycobacterium marinum]MDC8985541.1 hypothetical protein [Mycobacterium marinum]MDC9002844.1 hypothetical protein [Mycobacterium marinum]MDC9013580.1 hypothetical protein [Mycobacterium marinum]MDC9018940.1 hypothetical protein [Mycobacterium marinum]
MAVAAGFLIHLADATSRNAHDVQAVAQRVGDLVAAPPTRAGAAVGRPVPASPDAGVSRFALADHNAPSPPIAELGSALAGLPGAPQFHLATEARAGLTDFGAPGLPIPPLTGMPTPPDPAHLPSLPDLPDVSAVLVGLPTIAPLSTALGRFGGLAGPPNAASQLADTATQHTQMIATLTPQHTPRAGNPTPDHDSGSPDTAGAAASTTTNHRAPIDTHARLTPGATQSPLPHSP